MKNFIFFILCFLTRIFSVAAGETLPAVDYEKLWSIHEKITLLYGDINCELPEQHLVANFLPSNAKVLELGGDVGRNSCVIATILDDSRNMVTVEPRAAIIRYLNGNRNYNSLNFHIETSAVSKVPLIQKGWVTIPSEVVLDGYNRVNVITFDELFLKYRIDFDTLVVDCEGGLYYMLRDDPSMLNNINLIIIENDFSCIEHARFVFNKFRENGFEVIHNEGAARWDNNSFYQVWSK